MCIHRSPPSWTSLPTPHPTHLGHHRALGWAPWPVEQLPIAICFTCGSVNTCQSWSPSVYLISQHLCKDEMLGRVSYLCSMVETTHHSPWCLSSWCVVHGPFPPLKLLSILCSHETHGTLFSPDITWTLHSIQHWWALLPYRSLFLSFSHSTLLQLSLILSRCFSQLKLLMHFLCL